MMRKELLLIGAGGAGKELAFCLEDSLEWDVLGFVDDTMKPKTIVNNLTVFGNIDWLQGFKGNVAICIVNNPQMKRLIVRKLRIDNPEMKFPVVLNHNSIYSRSVEYGEGVVVAQPYNYLTVNIKIGNFVWINTRNDIGHGVEIGDYTTVFSRVNFGGEVKIGENCVIGTGVTFKPNTQVGNNVTVGAGAVVVKDIPDDVVVVGNPARVLMHKETDTHWYNVNSITVEEK